MKDSDLHATILHQLGNDEQTEINVFETNVPPRFHLYYYDGKNQLTMPPASQTVTLETNRMAANRFLNS